jgi:probable FeS assembly SUF system protein SufT
MVRPRYEEVEFTRACTVVQIPQGITVGIEAGTTALIMQELSDSYTVQIPTLGGLYRVAGNDADAIGREPPPVTRAECDPTKPVDAALVQRALRSVYDPEIPVNIVDLGLVYDLRIEPLLTGGSKVHVRMTLTAPGCGMGQIIAADVKRCLERLPGVAQADVKVVWEPPWTPQRLSPAARVRLGLESTDS